MTAERVNFLRPILGQYTRRFSVLDLGAGIYLPISPLITHDYNCVVVAVEENFEYFNLLKELPRYMVLKHHMTAEDLVTFGECEHFDVVIAFNFLHHFTKGWMEALEAILRMGTHVFIQLPSLSEDDRVPGHGQVLEELHQRLSSVTMIGEALQFPGHMPRPIWYRHNPERVLTRTMMVSHDRSAQTVMHANFSTCTADLQRLNKGVKEWIPGINLWNFCKLHGVWPSKSSVLKMLSDFKLPQTNHGDLTPWNIVIDGYQLYLVDGFEGWQSSDAEEMVKTIESVREAL